MMCQEFENAWNELIDAEAASEARTTTNANANANANANGADISWGERERALLDHAADCPGCRPVAGRYQALRRALRDRGPAPAVPVGFADRVLIDAQAPSPSAWPVHGKVGRERGRPVIVTVLSAAAASIVGILFLGQINRNPQSGPKAALNVTPVLAAPGEGGRGTEAVAVDRRALNHALAEATAATWDLALSASEPAARISREMLDAATRAEENPGQPDAVAGLTPVETSVAVPSLDSIAPDAAAAGAMLRQVSDHLATGVRPLSDTARHAFGFLLGPTLSKPDVPHNPPAQKGA